MEKKGRRAGCGECPEWTAYGACIIRRTRILINVYDMMASMDEFPMTSMCIEK